MSEDFYKNYSLKNSKPYSKTEYISFIIIFTLVIFILSNEYKYTFKNASFLKYFILVSIPHTIINMVSLITSKREEFEIKRCLKFNSNAFIIFQVTTKGRNIEVLETCIRSIIHWVKKLGNSYRFDYRIDIVVDEDLPEVSRKFFEDIRKRYDVNIIFVPNCYKTKNSSKFKARALHYAVEYRRKRGENTEKYWIYHLDEESIVGEDTILGILEFINEGKGRVAQGLIVYPNKMENNLFISFFDSIRPSEDLTRYKFQAKIGKVIFGLHGSHLLIRSDLEDKIGWDFGHVRAEDAVFGISINFHDRIRWLKGKLYEQSPRSFKDLFKQRSRWFYGKIDILKLKIPIRYKILIFSQIIGWLYGIFYVPIIVLIFINIGSIPKIYVLILSLNISNLVYMYWIGFRLNSENNNGIKYRKVMIILNILLIPIILMVESLIAWYALVTYRNNKNLYEIIKK